MEEAFGSDRVEIVEEKDQKKSGGRDASFYIPGQAVNSIVNWGLG